MLYRDLSQNVNGRALRGLDKSQKAALAVQIDLGEVAPPKLSQRQWALILNVPRSYILQAERLPAELRQAVRAGCCTLALASTIITDEKIEQAIKSAGIDRVWQLLCKQL